MVNLDAIFFKPEWMRCPQWRWQAVTGYLADPSQSTLKIRHDSTLYEGAQFIRMRKSLNGNTLACAKRHPEIVSAFDLYSNSRIDGWRWFLESFLMTGISDEEIVKMLKVDCSKDIIKAFRELYFDVRNYLHSEIATTANVLSISRQLAADHNSYDFTWKLFAYTWGADAFAEQFCYKKPLTIKKYKDWFKEISNERLAINSFHLTSDLRMAYNEQSLAVLKMAQDSWNISDKAMSDATEIAQRSFIDALNGHVDLTLMRASEKQGKVEPRANVDYSGLKF